MRQWNQRSADHRQYSTARKYGFKHHLMRVVPWALMVSSILCVTPLAQAGGGPENVFLVVNSRSWASRTIANHYVELRGIPSSNILYLDWDKSVETTDIATFRHEILRPIIKAIDKNRLGGQIDYIVYSSDFPYQIDYSSELPRPGKFTSGSITSLTFLYEMVMGPKGTVSQLGTSNNWYANTSTDPHSTTGFSNRYSWAGPQKRSVSDENRNYMLSTMLGYTSGRGNSVEQVIHYLKHSVLADGSHPKGTVYFMTNSDIRTITRKPFFKDTIQAIRREGGRAELVEGVTPIQKPDVIGLTMGKARYHWHKSGSHFLPGAICDNLTSFGGVLRDGASQTPLTEALKFAATASSGTVIEPYAIAKKFPNPVMHLHYQRGCSLAEAYYLSVVNPYQLLIVGDPLCQPFANIPTVSVEGIPSDGHVSGQVTLRPSVSGGSPGASVDKYEVFFDGRRRQTARAGQSMTFDSQAMPDGYHELRVVALMNDRVQTRGRAIIPIIVANRDRHISVKMQETREVPFDAKVTLKIRSKGSTGLALFADRHFLGKTPKPTGSVEVSAQPLGFGPARLMAVGISEEAIDNVFSDPIKFDVVPGRPWRALPVPVGTTGTDGLQLVVSGGIRQSVPSLSGSGWMKTAQIQPGQSFTLSGYFVADEDAIYQVQTQFHGELEISIDRKRVLRETTAKSQRFEVPVNLAQGGHQIAVKAKLKNNKLSLKFGHVGTTALAGPKFKH